MRDNAGSTGSTSGASSAGSASSAPASASPTFGGQTATAPSPSVTGTSGSSVGSEGAARAAAEVESPSPITKAQIERLRNDPASGIVESPGRKAERERILAEQQARRDRRPAQ